MELLHIFLFPPPLTVRPKKKRFINNKIGNCQRRINLVINSLDKSSYQPSSPWPTEMCQGPQNRKLLCGCAVLDPIWERVISAAFHLPLQTSSLTPRSLPPRSSSPPRGPEPSPSSPGAGTLFSYLSSLLGFNSLPQELPPSHRLVTGHPTWRLFRKKPERPCSMHRPHESTWPGVADGPFNDIQTPFLEHSPSQKETLRPLAATLHSALPSPWQPLICLLFRM